MSTTVLYGDLAHRHKGSVEVGKDDTVADVKAMIQRQLPRLVKIDRIALASSLLNEEQNFKDAVRELGHAAEGLNQIHIILKKDTHAAAPAAKTLFDFEAKELSGKPFFNGKMGLRMGQNNGGKIYSVLNEMFDRTLRIALVAARFPRKEGLGFFPIQNSVLKNYLIDDMTFFVVWIYPAFLDDEKLDE